MATWLRQPKLPRWLQRTITYLNSTDFLFRYHSYAAVAWLILLVPSWYLWRTSLFWILVVSIYANIATEWSSWQGVRAEIQALKATVEAQNTVLRIAEQDDE